MNHHHKHQYASDAAAAAAATRYFRLIFLFLGSRLLFLSHFPTHVSRTMYTLCLWCSYRHAIHTPHSTTQHPILLTSILSVLTRTPKHQQKKGAQPLSASAFISRWPNFEPSIFQWRQHKTLKDSLAHTAAVTDMLSFNARLCTSVCWFARCCYH